LKWVPVFILPLTLLDVVDHATGTASGVGRSQNVIHLETFGDLPYPE